MFFVPLSGPIFLDLIVLILVIWFFHKIFVSDYKKEKKAAKEAEEKNAKLSEEATKYFEEQSRRNMERLAEIQKMIDECKQIAADMGLPELPEQPENEYRKRKRKKKRRRRKNHYDGY